MLFTLPSSQLVHIGTDLDLEWGVNMDQMALERIDLEQEDQKNASSSSYARKIEEVKCLGLQKRRKEKNDWSVRGLLLNSFERLPNI